MIFFRRNTLLYYLYQLYKWLLFIPFLGASTLIMGAAAAGLATTLGPSVGTWIGVIWARLHSYLTPMFVSVTGRQHVVRRQSYIVVSNHQSQYDIFVLYGWLGIDFKWVMKQELRKVPGLGFGCAKLGHIFIDRSRTERALASINAAKKRIVDGISVIFFPEGTRSKTDRMLPFKKGAFRFALDLGLPILPVTISGTREILPASTFDLVPGKVRMTIHPPIAMEAYRDRPIDDLMGDVRKVIRSGLTE